VSSSTSKPRSSSVEAKAIDLVIKYEKKRGWTAKCVRQKGKGYDVESKNKSDIRFIEVKGLGAKQPYTEFWLYPTPLKQLGENISKLFLYIVYDLKNSPKLIIIPPDKLFKNLGIRSLLSFKATKTVLKDVQVIPLEK